ncbi:MAG: diaminopimelate decarboxylase [Candidatus Thermoplasmatota archaeon]|nr:diaminopimelate decarboxylase [Candidatus Thermoplasmatota archaeon]
MNQVIFPPFTSRDNRLFLEDHDLCELCDLHGTPLLVTSEKRLRENYRRIYNAFSSLYSRFEIRYAIKSNSNPAVISILRDEGSGVDVSSINELNIARYCGVPVEKILFSPNNASRDELLEALKNGVAVNFDDIGQLNILGDKHPETASFRINLNIEKGEFPGTTTAGPNAKFGMPESYAAEAYRQAREIGVRKFGIHVMIGSNVLSPDHFEHVAGEIFNAAGRISRETGIKFDFIDLGGGFGVPYRPEEKELNVDTVASSVINSLEKANAQYGLGNPKLLIEPGRYISADTTVLLGRVNNIKSYTKTFVGTDIGMNIMLRTALYGAYHHIVLANDLSRALSGPKEIVGQICENTDRIAKEREFPEARIDDIIAVFTSGSYVSSMSSNYNGRTRAREILLSDDGIHVVRERDKFEDFVRNTKIPDHLLDNSGK